MQTKVELISFTEHPIETLYKMWKESKDPKVHLDIDTLVRAKTNNSALYKDMCDTFKILMTTEVAVIQNLHFTFKLSNISVALREQLVRHRIGIKLCERVGVDYVPDLPDDGIWSQSMRVLSMGTFCKDQAYEVPNTITRAGDSAVKLYKKSMQQAEDAYNALISYGVPREDARMVIPLAAQHDLFWTLSMGALCHILHKRGCWIPQLGLWEPIIIGMVEELANKIHPVFRTLTQPPCVQNGKFTSCKFPGEVRMRRTHEDSLPPCPLAYNANEINDWSNNVGTKVPVTANDLELYKYMRSNYTKLWGYSTRKELEQHED